MIDRIWARIEANEGELFRQKRGGEFTYQVIGNALKPDRTERLLAKGQFEKALEFMPAENTKPLQQLQGPSYLFAILMDDRVRGNDW